MKLSFSTLGCPSWSWKEILRQAVSLGFDGIEVRGIQKELDNEKIDEFQDEIISATIAQLKSLGLKIPCLDTSVTFLGPGDLSEALRSGRASMCVAQKLGIPFIRVFGDRIPVGMGRDEALERVTDGIRELARYGEDIGMAVLLETHGDFSASPMIREMFSRIPSPAAGILWDAAHTFECGESPEATWIMIGPLVRHVHIKDINIIEGEPIPCLPGRGVVHIPNVLGTLTKANYTGWLSFEWEKRWNASLEGPDKALPAFLEYIRKYIKTDIR